MSRPRASLGVLPDDLYIEPEPWPRIGRCRRKTGYSRRSQFCSELAEGVGFEPTREWNPLPVFKTGALNHSATLPWKP